MMMMRNRKGMTMALGVIIAIVVLIVVALAVIAITSGALAKFGIGTSETTDDTTDCVKCLAEVTSYCASSPDSTTDLATAAACPSCVGKKDCLGGTDKDTCKKRLA